MKVMRRETFKQIVSNLDKINNIDDLKYMVYLSNEERISKGIEVSDNDSGSEVDFNKAMEMILEIKKDKLYQIYSGIKDLVANAKIEIDDKVMNNILKLNEECHLFPNLDEELAEARRQNSLPTQAQDRSISTDVREPHKDQIEEEFDFVPPYFIFEVDDQADVKDAKGEIEVEISKEEEKEGKKLEAEKVAEIVQTVFEAKGYYLSGLRMRDNFEKSEISKALPQQVRNKICDAYLCCVDPGDLRDPDFLNKKFSEAAGVGNKLNFDLASIHMAILTNTYVGYKLEQIEPKEEIPADTQEVDDVGNMKLENPGFTDEMPEFLKEYISTQGKKYISNRINDVLMSNDAMQAIVVLSPIEEFIDKARNDFANNQSNDKYGTMAQLYLKSSVNQEDIGMKKENFKDVFDSQRISWKLDDSIRNDPQRLTLFVEEAKKLMKDSKDIGSSFEGTKLEYIISEDNKNIGNDVLDNFNELMEKGFEVHFIINIDDKKTRDEVRDNIERRCSQHLSKLRITTHGDLMQDYLQPVIDVAARMGIALNMDKMAMLQMVALSGATMSTAEIEEMLMEALMNIEDEYTPGLGPTNTNP